LIGAVLPLFGLELDVVLVDVEVEVEGEDASDVGVDLGGADVSVVDVVAVSVEVLETDFVFTPSGAVADAPGAIATSGPTFTSCLGSADLGVILGFFSPCDFSGEALTDLAVSDSCGFSRSRGFCASD